MRRTPPLFILASTTLLRLENTHCLSFSVTRTLKPSQAAALVKETLLPVEEYAHRAGLGRKAQGISQEDHAPVQGQDNRLSLTYGEFPLESLDKALDRAVTYLGSTGCCSFLDLGSGCGRLVLYVALTRPMWIVKGLEISRLLHEEALQACERAANGGWIAKEKNEKTNHLAIHHSLAQDNGDLLRCSNLVFCYSTAFEASKGPSLRGSITLSDAWTDLFWDNCNEGCILVTTDKSLDERFQLLESFDVPNREVFESTVFIHRR